MDEDNPLPPKKIMKRKKKVINKIEWFDGPSLQKTGVEDARASPIGPSETKNYEDPSQIKEGQMMINVDGEIVKTNGCSWKIIGKAPEG